MINSSSSNHTSHKTPLHFWCFALVVVRLANKYLLVQERKHGQTWYVPAGRLEYRETFEQAAIREIEEESGIHAKLDGIIRIQLSPPYFQNTCYRQRIIFTASPIDHTQKPRTYANEDTLGARWVTIEEAKQLPLRGREVLELFEYVDSGKTIYPLDILGHE